MITWVKVLIEIVGLQIYLILVLQDMCHTIKGEGNGRSKITETLIFLAIDNHYNGICKLDDNNSKNLFIALF